MEEPSSPAGAEESEAQFLLRYLQTHDATCPLCGYNLRRFTVPRCPECGREIKLAVGVVNLFLLPWVVTMIMMAMAAGLGILFVIAVMFFGDAPSPSEMFVEAPFGCMGLGYGLCCIPGIVLLVS